MRYRTVRHDESTEGRLPKIDTFVFCEKHPAKELEFNCKDCEVIMCYKCNVLSHSGHKIEELDTAIERVLPAVSGDIKKLQQRSATYRAHSAKFQTHAKRIQSNADDVKEKIRLEQNRLMAAIKAEGDFKVAQVEKDAERRLKEITSDQEALDYTAASIEGLATWGSNVLNNTAGASLMVEVQRNLIPQLTRVLKTTVTLPKLDESVSVFEPMKMHENEFNLLGKIVTKNKQPAE